MNMHPSQPEQASADSQNLRMLQVGHYIFGLLYFLCSAAYVGVFFLRARYEQQQSAIVANDFPAEFPQVVAVHEDRSALWLYLFAGAILFVFWLYGGLIMYAGRCIGKRKGHTFILVMAVLNFFQVPLGLVLGIFTFIVLLRPSVKSLFTRQPVAPPNVV